MPTICCICDEAIWSPAFKYNDFGNDAYPLYEEGRACNACNREFVIPARMEAVRTAEAVRKVLEPEINKIVRTAEAVRKVFEPEINKIAKGTMQE